MLFFFSKWKAVSGLHDPLSNLTRAWSWNQTWSSLSFHPKQLPQFSRWAWGAGEHTVSLWRKPQGPWCRTSLGNLRTIRVAAADSCVCTWGWERIHDTLSKLSHLWSGFHHKGWICEENTRAPARNAKTKNYSSFYRSALCRRTFCDYGNVFFLWCPTPQPLTLYDYWALGRWLVQWRGLNV